MPERDGKTEYGGAFLSQMKSRARSLYEQVFAEIYIEENEEHPEQSSESRLSSKEAQGRRGKASDFSGNETSVLLRGAVGGILHPAAVCFFL